MATVPLHLSVVIPIVDGHSNLDELLTAMQLELKRLAIRFEIIIVADRQIDATVGEAAHHSNVRFLISKEIRGYGDSLRSAFVSAHGEYILTMEADFSHSPAFVENLWNSRERADITIASRYIPGGQAKMSPSRYWLSRSLNTFFSRGLSLHVRDMSSGFRLYRSSALNRLPVESRDFDILQEILVRALCEGRRVREIPFTYVPHPGVSSRARVIKFGMSYLRTFIALYRLRNSILSADYDARAYESPIPPQRYWQRQRFRHVTELTHLQGATLDVGCGSSRIISQLPEKSIALDILIRKLRYARRFKRPLVQGSGFHLPFADQSFSCVLCSQVIEHVPKNTPILKELCRVLAPGGLLVLGTPDYAKWQWRVIEAIYKRVLPSAYADEHISHYTKQELCELFESKEYILEDIRYILQGELILAFRKPAS